MVFFQRRLVIPIFFLYNTHVARRKRRHSLLNYFVDNLLVVAGLVFIWRGIWYVLDWIDITFLNGNHVITAVGGIIGGLLVLYLPDKDLKEIQKL